METKTVFRWLCTILLNHPCTAQDKPMVDDWKPAPLTLRARNILGSIRNDALEAFGIKTAYYEPPGTAHEWQTWRRCLRKFALLLFKN